MVNLVYGCTDPNASNYDPLANTNWVSASDSSNPCLYPGCTDSLAQNYDPLANVSDSSCTYSCQYNGYDDAVQFMRLLIYLLQKVHGNYLMLMEILLVQLPLVV